MKEKQVKKETKLFQYFIYALFGYIGVLTGYHSFKIIQYFLKPVPNPLMPLNFYKYTAFPYISFIPFLLLLLFLGYYLIKKSYFKKKHFVFYAVLILLFHLIQSSLLRLFDGFNPYIG